MWTQSYDPLGQIFFSALAATLPITFLFWALTAHKMRGHVAGLWATGLTVLVAVVIYKMPLSLALASTLQGALYGLFPVGWIVVAAMFLYRITVETGQFEIIKNSIASITEDRRLQALLIAFSFGAFLESASGFGTPVAISAAMLVGLGFEPLFAAGLCLIANTAPVAFGSIGTPILVASQVTGIDDRLISQMVGRQLSLVSLIIPFWLVFTMSGRRGVKEVWPAALVSGGSFAVAQWWTSQYLGPLLPGIISSLCSIVCLVLFLRAWQPARVFRFRDEGRAGVPSVQPFSKVAKAWSPFLVLTILVGSWGVKPVKALLEQATLAVPFPLIHNAIVAPDNPAPIAAIYSLNVLSATGSVILLAAIVSVVITGMRPADAVRLFNRTARSLAAPLVTVSAVLGFAHIVNSSGMTATMGMAVAGTGSLFPLFSPVLGWLGVFTTGSDTSANAVFGPLQTVTARRIGVNPVLTIAANSSGGVTGKMISPQSIAVACAATGLAGNESDLFRFTVRHSLLLVAIVSVMTYLQATVFRWMVPVIDATSGAARALPAGAGASTAAGWAWLGITGIVVAGLAIATGRR